MRRDRKDDRPEFYAYDVSILECIPATRHTDDGEPTAVMTIAKSNAIESIVITLRDARYLVTKLLGTLAGYEDQFAMSLLEDHFGADREGDFAWPTEREDNEPFQP